MVLYSHRFDCIQNKIIVDEVQAVETAKLYKSKNMFETLFADRRQIKKECIDTLICDYGLYMISFQPNMEKFKKTIVELKQAEIDNLNCKLSYEQKQLKRLEEIEVE